MSPFYGRKHELDQLCLLIQKKTASIVVVRGRRRIGKSRLIQEFGKIQKIKTITFSGLPPSSKSNEQSQKNEFARQLSQNLNIPFINSEDWSDLFWHLAEQTKKGRTLLVLDEISWMGSKDPDFLGKLKNAWDLHFSKNPALILVFCGSVSSWIKKNILGSTGFLGRISLDLTVHELSKYESSLFWKDKQGRISPYEIFKVLSVTGGVPKYLEEIVTQNPAEENISRLCYQPDGFLYREFDSIFSDLFSKRSTKYKQIVQILADAPKDLSQICQELSLEKGGVISRYLKELNLAGFVKETPSWSLKTGIISNLKRFRISDNYLRFYLKFIEPNKTLIESGLFQYKSVMSMPGWNAIMGLQFENLVLNNYLVLFERLKINPNDVKMFGPFFQRATARQKGAQVDLLIQTCFNCLYVCEVKFSVSELGIKVVDEMNEKIKQIAVPRGTSIRSVLIHVNGTSDALKDSGFFDYIIDFSDFLQTNKT